MKISVAMATYNGESYLRAQLDSLAEQLLRPIELHVGDDGSTDDTAKIVADFARTAPFPVHFRVNEKRLGYGQNFIETAQRCAGDWIAFSDQDDIWRPDKLEICARALQKAADPEILLVVHAAKVVNDSLALLIPNFPAGMRSEVRDVLGHPLNWGHHGFALVFSRTLINQIPTWPRIPTIFEDADPHPHDLWITTLANVVGKTLHIPETLALYRRHVRSASTGGRKPEGFSMSVVRSTGADHYRKVARMFRETACSLDAHAVATAPPWNERLAAGGKAYARLADALDGRAQIYEGDNLIARLRGVGGLVRHGYWGLGLSSFGPKAFVKDLAVAIARPLLAV